MRKRHQINKNYLLFIVSILLLTSCNSIESNFSAVSSKSSNQRNREKSSNNSENSSERNADKSQLEGITFEEENTRSDRPQMVAGAFLTCSNDIKEPTGMKADESSIIIGCALVRNTQKVNQQELNLNLNLQLDTGTSLPLSSIDAPADSKWHKYAILPKSDEKIKENGFIRMSVLVGNGSAELASFNFAINGLEKPSAASEVYSKSPTTVESSTPATKIDPAKLNFSSSANWTADVDIAAGFSTTSICSKGEVKEELDIVPWKSFVAQIILDALKKNEVEFKATSISGVSCFESIKSVGNDGKVIENEFAIDGDGCLFVKTKSGLTGAKYFVFSSRDRMDPLLFKENLLAFVKTKKKC